MPSAEIIRERPVSLLPEAAFDAVGNCLWVLFEDDEFSQWCGIFGAGDLPYEGKVIEAANGNYLILVSGKLYRVDANSRNFLFASEERLLTDVIYDRDRDIAIACNWTKLLCYSAVGLKWTSHRVSWDGISLERIDDSCVYGSVNDLTEGGASFVLHLDTLHVESPFDPQFF